MHERHRHRLTVTKKQTSPRNCRYKDGNKQRASHKHSSPMSSAETRRNLTRKEATSAASAQNAIKNPKCRIHHWFKQNAGSNRKLRLFQLGPAKIVKGSGQGLGICLWSEKSENINVCASSIHRRKNGPVTSPAGLHSGFPLNLF